MEGRLESKPSIEVGMPKIEIKPDFDLKAYQAEGYLYVNNDGSVGHGAYTKEVNLSRISKLTT